MLSSSSLNTKNYNSNTSITGVESTTSTSESNKEKTGVIEKALFLSDNRRCGEKERNVGERERTPAIATGVAGGFHPVGVKLPYRFIAENSNKAPHRVEIMEREKNEEEK